MRVSIIGAKGQLGSDLCTILSSSDIVPLTHSDIEITDINSVIEALTKCKPDVVINTAAYVRVDDCEINQDKAFLVNALGARNVAVVAQELGSKLVHISTDAVFGNELQTHTVPYTEFDNASPINVYGKSKLAGEELVRHLCCRHFVVRTSGLFGLTGSSGKGGNFIESILSIASNQEELKVVNDQVLSPTYAKDLANKIAQLITTEYYGIYHITNRSYCSWYEFACEIIKQAGLKLSIIPISSDQYPQKAKRSSFSVLDNYHLRLLGMDDIRPWQEALADYIREKTF
ncbi:dTDP-4-dehydrorhamnose reductase [Chloroflexota bacterium]